MTRLLPAPLNPGVDVNPDERFAVCLHQPLTVELPDRTLVIPGFRQTYIPAARRAPETRCEHDGHYDVRLRPAGSDLAQFSYATAPPTN